jgi:hypothetical protein
MRSVAGAIFGTSGPHLVPSLVFGIAELVSLGPSVAEPLGLSGMPPPFLQTSGRKHGRGSRPNPLDKEGLAVLISMISPHFLSFM